MPLGETHQEVNIQLVRESGDTPQRWPVDRLSHGPDFLHG